MRSRAYGRARGATTVECGVRVGDAMAREDTGTPEQRAAQIADRSQDLRHHTGRNSMSDHPVCECCGDPAVRHDGHGWRCLAHLHDRPKQLDLDGQPQKIDPGPPALVEPEAPSVQLGLDVDVPVAIRLPRGQGVAYQHPLGGEA